MATSVPPNSSQSRPSQRSGAVKYNLASSSASRGCTAWASQTRGCSRVDAQAQASSNVDMIFIVCEWYTTR